MIQPAVSAADHQSATRPGRGPAALPGTGPPEASTPLAGAVSIQPRPLHPATGTATGREPKPAGASARSTPDTARSCRPPRSTPPSTAPGCTRRRTIGPGRRFRLRPYIRRPFAPGPDRQQPGRPHPPPEMEDAGHGPNRLSCRRRRTRSRSPAPSSNPMIRIRSCTAARTRSCAAVTAAGESPRRRDFAALRFVRQTPTPRIVPLRSQQRRLAIATFAVLAQFGPVFLIWAIHVPIHTSEKI